MTAFGHDSDELFGFSKALASEFNELVVEGLLLKPAFAAGGCGWVYRYSGYRISSFVVVGYNYSADLLSIGTTVAAT